MKKTLAAAVLVAAAVLLPMAGALAQQQSDAKPPAPAAETCPADARELPLEALYGSWEARFDGLPGAAAVQLARHPDYAGVRGSLRRADGSIAQLAGDIGDDGALDLDESLDGHSISGVWVGTLQPGSCGREFRGAWRNAADDSMHPFVLHKIAHPEEAQ